MIRSMPLDAFNCKHYNLHIDVKLVQVYIHVEMNAPFVSLCAIGCIYTNKSFRVCITLIFDVLFPPIYTDFNFHALITLTLNSAQI